MHRARSGMAVADRGRCAGSVLLRAVYLHRGSWTWSRRVQASPRSPSMVGRGRPGRFTLPAYLRDVLHAHWFVDPRSVRPPDRRSRSGQNCSFYCLGLRRGGVQRSLESGAGHADATANGSTSYSPLRAVVFSLIIAYGITSRGILNVRSALRLGLSYLLLAVYTGLVCAGAWFLLHRAFDYLNIHSDFAIVLWFGRDGGHAGQLRGHAAAADHQEDSSQPGRGLSKRPWPACPRTSYRR